MTHKESANFRNNFNRQLAQAGGEVECFNSITQEWEKLGLDNDTKLYSVGVFDAIMREGGSLNDLILRNV